MSQLIIKGIELSWRNSSSTHSCLRLSWVM